MTQTTDYLALALALSHLWSKHKRRKLRWAGIGTAVGSTVLMRANLPEAKDNALFQGIGKVCLATSAVLLAYGHQIRSARK